MSYLWAVGDPEIQSQAIWEISTWSAWLAAPRSCHIHWVDWLNLSISLLFGFQWRQNLAMAVHDIRRSSGGWQVFTESILCESSDWAGQCQDLIWLADCSCSSGNVRVVVTPGQSRLVTPQPAAQLGLRNQLLGAARGSTVLSQPGNVINTNYLLLLPSSPDLPLTLQKTSIYHTRLYCTMLLCSLSPGHTPVCWEYYTHNLMIIIMLSY